MSALQITPEILNLEYVSWTSKYSIGRNDEDLRFGQYIWMNYKLPRTLEEDKRSPFVLFENAFMAYKLLKKHFKKSAKL